jgi:hypothetical protein
MAMINEQKAREIAMRNAAAQGSDGEIRIPVSSQRIYALSKNVVCDAPIEQPKVFTTKYRQYDFSSLSMTAISSCQNENTHLVVS